ncbi:MAG: hypothetical protein PQJ60_06310 [Spirochaetales bacterium]|nr:hypothetical protein [Spirochaetales bacterium]
MEEKLEYIQQLEEGLKGKRLELEQVTLPELKENLRNFGNTFHMMYAFLVQKGFLKEDLYNYEQTSKLDPPSSDPIADAELIPELSFRLSSYDSVLDYLNNIYDVDMDKLNLGGIKKVLSIIDYIKWSHLGTNTTHPITRALTIVMDKIVTSSNDPVSSEIRFNSISAQAQNYNNIKKELKDISIYQREAYKFRLRSVILPSVSHSAEMVAHDLKGILMAIKLEMTSQLPGAPFYRELIEEIFSEDYGLEGDKKKDDILKRLNVAGQVKKKEAKKKETERKVDKGDLLKIIPSVAKSGDQLASALAKLDHNRDITSSGKKTLIEILRRFFSRKEDDIYYEIKVMDPGSGHNRKVKINFTAFSDKVRKKTQLLRNIGNSNSQQYEKLTEYTEEMLQEFIENNLSEIRSHHKKMVGLDEMFKKVDDPAIRARIKGIKVETDTLKRLYMECNTSLKEYIAIKEEMAQLKALGIDH